MNDNNGQKRAKNVYNRNKRHKTDNHVLLLGSKKLCYCVSERSNKIIILLTGPALALRHKAKPNSY